MTNEIELLSALNEFYEGAFDRLVQYTFAVIALVGVVIPLISGVFQWRSIKSEKKSLEHEIKEEIELAKVKIFDDLVKRFGD